MSWALLLGLVYHTYFYVSLFHDWDGKEQINLLFSLSLLRSVVTVIDGPFLSPPPHWCCGWRLGNGCWRLSAQYQFSVSLTVAPRHFGCYCPASTYEYIRVYVYVYIYIYMKGKCVCTHVCICVCCGMLLSWCLIPHSGLYFCKCHKLAWRFHSSKVTCVVFSVWHVSGCCTGPDPGSVLDVNCHPQELLCFLRGEQSPELFRLPARELVWT